MKRSFRLYVVFLMIAVFAFIFGCEKTFIGLPAQNKSPEVWLSSGPVEGTTTGYQVHFYWGGWDPDGEVSSYEFAVVDGFPFGFNHEDTTGLDKWTNTALHDSIFRVTANDTAAAHDTLLNGSWYTRYDKAHTFFIRAIDLEGKRSDPVYRSFTAWTLAPFIEITMPRPPSNRAATVSLGKVIKFEWQGTDPIDSPSNTQDPDSIRYMYHRVDSPGYGYRPYYNIVRNLNEEPWRYEKDWSPWIYYRAPGDSGRSTVLGDYEPLELSKQHIFAVQAKDEAGAVTAIFTKGINVRQFLVSNTAGPLLTVVEPFLGGFRFTKGNPKREKRDLPPGVGLAFRWWADASGYGGKIVCYQYGWDVADLNNPSDWGSDCSPYNLSCRAIWYSGVHTLYVRATDNSGSQTLAQVELSIVPFSMDRNLLWVDDFPSNDDFQQELYNFPRESEHDDFWLDHCKRTVGFDPARDVYDAKNGGYNSEPPKVSLIGRYKNIIWTYSSDFRSTCIDDVIIFTPESMIGEAMIPVNFLSIFLAKGGHVLTEGMSERGAGLAAILLPLQVTRAFPLNIKCEFRGNTDGCEGDTSSVNSYAYKDYCVTMLDKIDAALRTDGDMPLRRVRNYDCMYPGAVKAIDAWHDSVPGMPSTLNLWSEVVATDRFYAPNSTWGPGGFTPVEIYDPYYWMYRNRVSSQGCFHPMYRMIAKNGGSALNNQTVAIWVTKYARIVPEVQIGVAVAAPSAHFGFELWFFNRTQCRTVLDTIFRKWQILATP